MWAADNAGWIAGRLRLAGISVDGLSLREHVDLVHALYLEGSDPDDRERRNAGLDALVSPWAKDQPAPAEPVEVDVTPAVRSGGWDADSWGADPMSQMELTAATAMARVPGGGDPG